ncbi:MAG: transglycosylase SLT domain-containing protein [Candidatus Binatia bacterium]
MARKLGRQVRSSEAKMTGSNQLISLVLSACLIAGCAVSPPSRQENICAVFDQFPDWYDYAKASEAKWGTPTHILMAFIKRESSYRNDAKPPYDWFLFIPLGRKSSAKGYAQVQDPTWEDYTDETGGLFKSRSDINDALDFIGWYNNKSNQRLGISKWDPKRLYLAYHEGHGGYQRKSYEKKPKVLRTANEVNRLAREYGKQLRRCEHRFKCRKWYQFWPLCRK